MLLVVANSLIPRLVILVERAFIIISNYEFQEGNSDWSHCSINLPLRPMTFTRGMKHRERQFRPQVTCWFLSGGGVSYCA